MKLVTAVNAKLPKCATERQRMKWKKNALRDAVVTAKDI